LLDDYQQDQLIEDIDDYLFYSDEWLIDWNIASYLECCMLCTAESSL
jgi:hypothetical protein